MRRTITAAVALVLLGAGATPTIARPAWQRRIDRMVGPRSVGISVWRGATRIYEHAPRARRIPASNQKLLAAMALLDALGPRRRLPTVAAARSLRNGVIDGDLWVVGRGDPTLGTGVRGGGDLGGRTPEKAGVRGGGDLAQRTPEKAGVRGGGGLAQRTPEKAGVRGGSHRLHATRVGRLAQRIAAAGVRTVRGRVMGSTGYFRRDWDAPGWRPYYRDRYIALPTALTFRGNIRRGRPISDPERRVAARLTARLRAMGVAVAGRPGSGHLPQRVAPIARVRSPALRALLGHMNRTSSNFYAEVLGKRLAVARRGPPGSIAGGARSIAAWARRQGVAVSAHDSSGLSSANRISARGLARLLQAGRDEPWGRALVRSLATPGRGTLEDRLGGLPVRAKTGTLDGVSALSGWVWLRRHRRWAAFSILSHGLAKASAVEMEDRIVRILSRYGRAPRLQPPARPSP